MKAWVCDDCLDYAATRVSREVRRQLAGVNDRPALCFTCHQRKRVENLRCVRDEDAGMIANVVANREIREQCEERFLELFPTEGDPDEATVQELAKLCKHWGISPQYVEWVGIGAVAYWKQTCAPYRESRCLTWWDDRAVTTKEWVPRRAGQERTAARDASSPIAKAAPSAETRLTVTVSRRRAAELLFTDVDPGPMPWETFDLVIDGGLGWVTKIRCERREFVALVSKSDAVVPRADVWEQHRLLFENVLYGTCAAVVAKPSAAKSGARRVPWLRQEGPMNADGALELFGRRPPGDIEIDLVAEAEEVLSSASPGKPRRVGASVLVRGHMRSQPCGPGRSMRKQSWVRPHYHPRLGFARSQMRYAVRG
jgi:hypothetical protein